jgi:hypothetical protein
MSNNLNDQLSLKTVATQLSDWRSNKQPGGNKIPDAIWHSIFELATEYPRGVICKQLGISGSQLTTNLKRLGQPEHIYSNPAALCKVPASIPKNISTPKEMDRPSPLQTLIVEYVRQDGLVMKIHTTNMALLDLIQTFFKANTNAANNI